MIPLPRLIAPLLLVAILAIPARAEPPAVVADLPPVAGIAAAVMEGVGTPGLLVEGAADPHHFQLRPSDARALAAADLVIWVGPEMTPWLAKVLDRVAPGTRSLVLLDLPGTVNRAPMFGGHEGHHEDEEHHGEPGHEPRDPHAWLDPHNAAAWTDAIAAALAEIDSGNAARYRANAAAARVRIAAAEAEAAARLAPVRAVPLVAGHDAYAHFADRFRLNVVDSIADTEANRPGAASLSRLAERLRRGEVRCLLTEVNEPDPLIDRLSQDSGVPMVTLDPLGVLLDPGPDHYPRLILGMAEAIAGCAAQ